LAILDFLLAIHESTILQLLTPVNERPCVDTFETGVLREK
jgi:hypothetical protein